MSLRLTFPVRKESFSDPSDRAANQWIIQNFHSMEKDKKGNWGRKEVPLYPN